MTINLSTMFLAASTNPAQECLTGVHCVQYDDSGVPMMRVESTDGEILVCVVMTRSYFNLNCLVSFELQINNNLIDFCIMKEGKFFIVRTDLVYPNTIEVLPIVTELIPTNQVDTVVARPIITFKNAFRVYKILKAFQFEYTVYTLYSKKAVILTIDFNDKISKGFILTMGTSLFNDDKYSDDFDIYTSILNTYVAKKE